MSQSKRDELLQEMVNKLGSSVDKITSTSNTAYFPPIPPAKLLSISDYSSLVCETSKVIELWQGKSVTECLKILDMLHTFLIGTKGF